MKILVYGSRGWIGNQFISLLKNKDFNFFEGKSRVDDYVELKKEIDQINPTHIVSFIGRTHGGNFSTIDYLESKDKLFENVRDNLFGPFLLCQICTSKNIHYTYLGTGCIFKYEDEKLFDEESLPNFFGSSYSVVKGFTDRMMHTFPNILNLRIRMPIVSSYHKRNFITKITSYEKICSIPNSMTVLDELLPCVITMMIEKKEGTVNLVNPGVISHNEILEMYKEIVDPTFTYQNFTKEEQAKILKSDRSNNHLDTSKLVKMFPHIKDIKTSVRNCLMKYKLPRNLLVTGGLGFIGSNFINNYFPNMKFDTMVNLDANYYCANIENINIEIRNDPKFTNIEGKCQDEKIVKEILRNHRITHVIHCAAQSHVTNSFEESLKYTEDNIKGTHVLLECCRQWNKIIKFIHISTDEVYGDKMEIMQDEQNIFCPTNPYAATKAGAELIVQSYYHSFKIPILIVRGNNTYGPNQYPEKLIPKFIQLLRENKKLPIEGSGEQVRGFLHVEDVVDAYVKILEKGIIGEIYNIGCEEEHSVLSIAKKLLKLFNKEENYIHYVKDRPYNDKRYYISNKKLKDLGWNHKINIEEGLKKLIN